MLFFTSSVFAAEFYLRWIDPKTQTRFRIDLKTNELRKQSEFGNWQLISKIKTSPNSFSDIYPFFENNYFFFDKGNRIRFTVDGMGYVFDYFPDRNELIKLDTTFHHGFNYESAKFVRNGALYSAGGEGFWNHNTQITFFDEDSKNWELVRPKNKGPLSICGGYQAYDSINDVYYSGASHIVNFLEDQTTGQIDDFFKFNFKNNSWELLGKINPKLPFQTKNIIIWTGKLFIHINRSDIFIIDPIRNEVRLYKDNLKTFSLFTDYLVQGDTILAFRQENIGLSLKMNISEINSKSKYWGKFYTTGIASYWYYGFTTLFTFLVLFFFWKYNHTQKSKNLGFTDLEKLLLEKFLSLGSESYLSTHDINLILNSENKSQENQRRIRFNVIGQLNKKLKLKYGSPKGIERKSPPEDKRLTIYVLDPEIVSELNKTLR